MRKLLLPFLALVAASSHAQIVTNTIDPFHTFQQRRVVDGTSSSTIVAAGAIGGFRSISLTAVNAFPEEEDESQLTLSAAQKNLRLSTPSVATATFTITWGGSGGTNGLGGIDLIAGNPDASQSSLKFDLTSADFASSFTWSFTDTAAQTAVYNGNLPTNTTNSPRIPFDIALSSFTGSINWNSINFITFSGGGVPELDLTISAPFSVQTTMMAPVPEPGTWAAAALLAGLAGFIHWRRRRANA
jgi:hypothetical protein